MNRNDRFTKPNAEEPFAAAASRLQAGESIPDILASYPPALHDELLEMLSVVEVIDKMHHAPVPLPSSAKRAAAKRQFLATAAQMRLEQQAKLNPTPVAPTRTVSTLSRPAARRAARRAMNPWQRFIAGLQDIFGVNGMRLAPLVITLALVIFGTSTLVQAAQKAIPGDAIYPLKQTLNKWELELAPPSQRELVRQEQERELAEDVAKAADRAEYNQVVVQAEDTLIYYGGDKNLLNIGGLKVIARYQPDANQEVFKPMTIDGELQPGAQVDLTYQILPGGGPTVQGIALTVTAPPSETEVVEVDTPQATSPEVIACSGTTPEGWVPYSVVSGDSLIGLAQRGGTTADRLAEVNCLGSSDEMLIIGQELLVPADALKTDVPQAACNSEIPEGWELYTVQDGDMLYRLAGDDFSKVLEVNCLDLESANLIGIGDQLYLPAQ